MANQPRTTPVVDFPFTPKDPEMANVLRRCLGKVSSMVVLPLFGSIAATSVGGQGAGPIFLKSGCSSYNFADMGIDEVRLTGFGSSDSTATVIDFVNASTGNTLACQVTSLPSSVGWFTGPWTRVSFPNTDANWGPRTTILSTKTLSLYAVFLQCRSLNFRG